jgi:hypothetical protein
MEKDSLKDDLGYFRGETVHDYIGVLVEMILKIEDSIEIGNLDKDRIRVLLTDSISILNTY